MKAVSTVKTWFLVPIVKVQNERYIAASPLQQFSAAFRALA